MLNAVVGSDQNHSVTRYAAPDSRITNPEAQSTNLGAAVAGLRADLAEMSTGSRADLAAAVTDLRADLAEMRRDLTARLDSLTVRGGSAKTRHVSEAVPEVDQPVGNTVS